LPIRVAKGVSRPEVAVSLAGVQVVEDLPDLGSRGIISGIAQVGHPVPQRMTGRK